VKRLFAALVLLLAPLHLAGQQAPGFGTYSYDGAGNVTAAGNDTFVYDEYGRIRKASLLQGSTAHTQEFTYDRYGNIRTITTSGESNPAVPAVDEATNRINLPGPTTNMVGTYDASGNLTRYSGVDEFRYDALDVMTESIVAGERRVYLYTANNERIGILNVAGNVIIGSEWTLRDASAKVLRRLSRDAAGAWRWDEDYIYRGSQLLAAEVPGNTLHFHSDHLGTPRVITGNGGVRIAAHTYYPFGRELTASSQDGERMKFTGHERDATNLDYMHARSYLPWTGRFLSVDPTRASAKPSVPQSWNRYSYAANNPLKFVDRNGQYYELASSADRQFFIDAIASGTSNKAARELVQRQAGDPLHKIVLRAGTLPGAFVFGDSSRLHAPYRTIAGNLFPSGITTTVDKGKLAMTNYPTPTISTFHELKHVDTILYQGMAANARQPDTTTLNTTTRQVTTNSIFEDFGRAAATTADDPMHALSPDAVGKLIANPGEGKAKTVTPCESIMCLQRSQ
jgi:RHS repeat-associated protein